MIKLLYLRGVAMLPAFLFPFFLSHADHLTTGGSPGIETITTEGLPACDAIVPTGLEVRGITGTKAFVSWQDVPKATFEVRYRVSMSTEGPWTTVSTGNTSITLNDLTVKTQYEYQVRSKCSSNDISDYSASVYAITRPSTDFITTWLTTSPNEQITIPTTGEGYDYTVDWEDGEVTTGISGDATHTYSTSGIHTVRISGQFPRIYFNNNRLSDKGKIRTVEQWGNIEWSSMEGAFFGCSNFTINAEDAPDLSRVRSMKVMFAHAPLFNGPVNHWNTSNVTNMDGLFAQAYAFNQPLNKWDVSHVTTMGGMFDGARLFNQPLNNWIVTRVTNFRAMFKQAYAFDQNLGSWQSYATSRALMFDHSGMSCAQYSATLIGWLSNTPVVGGVTLGAAGLQYSIQAEDARRRLTIGFNWTIEGDQPSGSDCGSPLVATSEMPEATARIASQMEIEESESSVTLGVFPSPSAGEVTIRYSSPVSGKTQVIVHDMFGNRIDVLADEFIHANEMHTVRFNEAGEASNGLYLVEVRIPGWSIRKKMIIRK